MSRALTTQGHASLGAFRLNPKVLHVNHGSYGAATRRALDEQARLRSLIEERPSRYFRRQAEADLLAAREAVAAAFGGAAEDYVFVDNATAGCNTAIAGVPLSPGDEILCTSSVYGAVRNALRHRAAMAGARLVEVPDPVPVEDANAVLPAVEAGLTERTRLAVFDHVASTTALRFPVRQLAGLCRGRGVAVLIDGAHAPGMLDLDIPSVEADFYTCNGHKWLCAPRGCGILWVAPEWQDRLRPLVISHGYGGGFWSEFRWTGTRDPTPWACLPTVLQTFEALGGRDLMARNRALAAEAARFLVEELGTETAGPPEMHAAMASVRLPVEAVGLGSTDEVQYAIGERFAVDTSIVPFGSGIGVRISAHVYNELRDYERLLGHLREYFGIGRGQPSRRV